MQLFSNLKKINIYFFFICINVCRYFTNKRCLNFFSDIQFSDKLFFLIDTSFIKIHQTQRNNTLFLASNILPTMYVNSFHEKKFYVLGTEEKINFSFWSVLNRLLYKIRQSQNQILITWRKVRTIMWER